MLVLLVLLWKYFVLIIFFIFIDFSRTTQLTKIRIDIYLSLRLLISEYRKNHWFLQYIIIACNVSEIDHVCSMITQAKCEAFLFDFDVKGQRNMIQMPCLGPINVNFRRGYSIVQSFTSSSEIMTQLKNS